MYIARILYPVEVLGPGKRIGIWFCGCKHKCNGCSNPELWKFDEKYKTTIKHVLDLISQINSCNQIDGFTITGGDPMYQYNDLMNLIPQLKKISNDILVYTGFTINELHNYNLHGISVLIDGRYIEKLNNGALLRGSSNQNIHILERDQEEKYKLYLKTEKNRIQNFITVDGVISVGIHHADFNK